ncbi:MAG: hypothetical protein J2P44_13780, partial [Candidatus Dormibacteraeota bacterium]|nr:hypothetical protein [Candidatus Dormibacteraeota bacterium]
MAMAQGSTLAAGVRSAPGWARRRGGEPLEVHQFVPSLLPRDAVGNHMLATRRELRQAGVGATIWAGLVHPSLRRAARSYQDFPEAPPRGRTSVALY